jgi:hypothetical protein
VSVFRRFPALSTGVSLVIVSLYLVASLGVLPSPRVLVRWFGHATGERYPCETCGCGCATAMECWTHCCCHSEHQRLVWAIEHGVAPPEGVEFEAEQWVAAANAVKPGSARCALCVPGIKDKLRRGVATAPVRVASATCGTSAEGGCCGSCDRSSTGTCDGSCDGKSCGARACEAGARAEVAPRSCCAAGKSEEPTWPGPSISALSCKGLHELLTMTLPPSPPVRVAAMILPEPEPDVPARPDDSLVHSRVLEVPDPPPRV